ncbi:hypothetical protein DPSP01_001811 [Paraphaeosphaeria sporulosa]
MDIHAYVGWRHLVGSARIPRSRAHERQPVEQGSLRDADLLSCSWASFVDAAIYLTLQHFVLYCGPEFSLLKPRLYPWLFVGCDFASIVMQAIGGGVAAGGGISDNIKVVNVGNSLILAGIAFQVAAMSVCGLLVLTFLWRYRKARATLYASNEKSAYDLSKASNAVAGSYSVRRSSRIGILEHLDSMHLPTA